MGALGGAFGIAAPAHAGDFSAARNVGLNAATGEYEDLVKSGVIDPAKVVRTALQDAASVAGLLVTTEAMIAEKPKKAAPAPMPGAGLDY